MDGFAEDATSSGIILRPIRLCLLTAAVASMLSPRSQDTVTVLFNGAVLVAGGVEIRAANDLSSAEIFQ